MDRGHLFLGKFLLALLLGLLAARPAMADDAPQAPRCLANAPADVAVGTLLNANVQWHCATRPSGLAKLPVDSEAERVLVRFAISVADPAPLFFTTRLGTFDALTLAVRTDEQGWTSRTLSTAEMTSQPTGPTILANLPETAGKPREVIAIIDRPSHAPTVLNAQLHEADPARTAQAQRTMVLIAIVLGMVLLPILFDLTFYNVLRQSFLPWHMAMSASFGLLLFTRSGLINIIAPVGIEAWRFLMIAGLTAAIASSLMFMRSFIEPGKLAPRIAAVIPWVVWMCIILTGLHALSIPLLRPVSSTLHAVGVVVPFALIVVVILQSVWRGSRAGFFILIGWVPIIASILGRILTNLTPLALPSDMLTAFYIGMMTEMVATAMAVGYRFMKLKKERDLARAEAVALDTLSSSDPLTGLGNRRAIEPQFEQLRREGFNTIALIDLDEFKHVNDEFGHAIGDDVLKAVAIALRPDRDTMAVRLGGEEFMLLLRGAKAAERAERMRQAIPVIVAREVAALDRIVTASMGVISIQRNTRFEIAFEELYAKVDRLLYEAKAQGRNRTVKEKLSAFVAHVRREAANAA
ncbi:sensor domain-containing diguanylate cyclase [Parerythrobacter jejuensis]|uniref:diguanylate cyclase n=1 Tax=Parerythrobacter jejuensis TaxID=795812 RepID=A0A845AWK2_9SPHN|nr:diguanylate cyclase [Parerythrobacter jejuensis]MXP31168.1 diguanylate cyclase [Parerythrobacter jejuensis]MXP33928.1 diguanylate cyclase [Parerythrobacter jejuensis]